MVQDLRRLLRRHLWMVEAATAILLAGQGAVFLVLVWRLPAFIALAGVPPALVLLGVSFLKLRSVYVAVTQMDQDATILRLRAGALEKVLESSQALWSQRSRADLLQSLATSAHRMTGAAAVMAYLCDDAAPAVMKRVALVAPSATLVGRARLTTPAPGRGIREQHSDEEGRVLLVPLEAKARVLGMLRLTGVPAELEGANLEAVTVLVAQAVAALTNAQQHENAVAQASTDSLTGLLNYKALHTRLEEEVARSKRSGRSLCLMMIDLDNFRTINNQHGHQAGDTTLMTVAGALRDTIRLSDLAARQGGDEFAVVLPDTTLDEALVVGERMCVAIAERTTTTAGIAISTSASIGVAALPVHATTGEALIRAADQAAYAAKHRGKGRVCRPEDAVAMPDNEAAALAVQLKDANMATVEALAAAVDAKDAYTRGHSQRVSAYAVAIAQALEVSEDDVTRLRLAGLLHDVGKIGIPDAILTKQGALTDDEFTKLAQHPVIGERMLAAVPFLQAVLPAVRHHHERWDGRGYPDQLVGAAIPLDAAIMMVADSFDAMTSSRTYRPALRVSEACQRVREGSGQQFDPRVVTAFERAVADGTLKALSPGGTVMFRGDGPARASTGPLRVLQPTGSQAE